MKKLFITLLFFFILQIFWSFQCVLAENHFVHLNGKEVLKKDVKLVFNRLNNTHLMPQVNCSACILMDYYSGRVMYEKNSQKRMPMASTTKIMTAMIAIENCDLDEEVIVSKRAAAVGGSELKLKAGSKYKLRELLNGLLVRSGNDCAIAIAEKIGGDVEGFLNLMNRKAKSLGAKNTFFKSPHGLDIPGHYSTAYDLAIMARYALSNKLFSSIVSSKSAWFPTGILNNTNELLTMYPWADGVKTGYTGLAGRCLVASATKNNWKLISVVLNAPTRQLRGQGSKNLLEYGFTNYKKIRLNDLNEKVARIPVYRGIKKDVLAVTGEMCDLPLNNDEQIGLKKIFIPKEQRLIAPIYNGSIVGHIEYRVKEKLIIKIPVIVNEFIRKKSWRDYLYEVLSAWSYVVKKDNVHSDNTR